MTVKNIGISKKTKDVLVMFVSSLVLLGLSIVLSCFTLSLAQSCSLSSCDMVIFVYDIITLIGYSTAAITMVIAVIMVNDTKDQYVLT